MGPDHSGMELGTDSRLIPSGEAISMANSSVLSTRPWEDSPQIHDAKNVAANDMLMSYSVLRTTECVCLAGASDTLPKFVDSPRYSRHDGATPKTFQTITSSLGMLTLMTVNDFEP